MFDQFFAHSASERDLEPERTAYQFAWRPVGARPLSAALTAETTPRVCSTRPPLPSFELLADL